MKSLYADSYELILEMVDIAVGLNNISVRGSYERFETSCKIDSWENYCKKTKSERMNASIEGEPFCRAVPVNRHIRNAIAHYNYDFDAGTREITFTDQFKAKENIVRLYLIDLAELCYENIAVLIYLNELIYSLQKRWYVKEGLTLNIAQ